MTMYDLKLHTVALIKDRLIKLSIAVSAIETIDMADPAKCIFGSVYNREFTVSQASTQLFGGVLSHADLWELFGPAGCGDAKTGKAASEYIDAFIVKKFKT